jgi:hypothetical protein
MQAQFDEQESGYSTNVLSPSKDKHNLISFHSQLDKKER